MPKRWSLRGNLKQWWASRRTKDNSQEDLQERNGWYESGRIHSCRTGMCHQEQRHMDHKPTSTPFDDTSTISHQPSFMTMRSDFRTPALQSCSSMMPNLQHAPYARSTHLDLESFDPSTMPTSQTPAVYQDHDQTKRTDCYDSGHSASCCSSQQSETKIREDRQKHQCEILIDGSSGNSIVEESTHAAQDKLRTQVCEDEAETSEDVSRLLVGNCLSGNSSSARLDDSENATRIHTFQSPEPSPPLTIRNLIEFEGAENARHAESAIAEGHSVPSRTPSQITNASRTSSKRSAAVMKTSSAAPRRYRGKNSRSEQFSLREAQVYQERRKEIRELMTGEDQRASRDTTLSPNFHRLPTWSATSPRSRSDCRRSIWSSPDLQNSRSYSTLRGMSMGPKVSPDYLERAGVQYAQSVQTISDSGSIPIGYDSTFSQSTTDQLHHRSSKRSLSKSHSDGPSISSTGFVDASDHISVRNHQSGTPSIASSLHGVQHRPSANPSPRHLRYPGGPTPVDARNHTIMNSHSSGSDPYSRPFTGFSGEYIQPQRPHSVVHPVSGYQPGADFLHHDAYAKLAGYSHQLGHDYSRSTPNLGRSASRVSMSLSSVGHTHGPNPMPYVPPSGPLMTDVMTPSAPPRGQRRNPKEIPLLQCAANVNMAVSWDANGEPIGYHYDNPQESAIKQWQGGVHAVEEMKKQRRGKVRGMGGERAPAKWRSPNRLHGTIHEETFVPDGRGLYGFVTRGQAEGTLSSHGKKAPVLSNPTSRSTVTPTADFQKQLADRRTRAYEGDRASRSLGQLGLRYSHIERREARRREKLEEQPRQQREREEEEREKRERERQMVRLKEEARKEVIREMSFELGGGVERGGSLPSMPAPTPASVKKSSSGFWGWKGRG